MDSPDYSNVSTIDNGDLNFPSPNLVTTRCSECGVFF